MGCSDPEAERLEGDECPQWCASERNVPPVAAHVRGVDPAVVELDMALRIRTVRLDVPFVYHVGVHEEDLG